MDPCERGNEPDSLQKVTFLHMKLCGISGLMDTEFKTTHDEFQEQYKHKIAQFLEWRGTGKEKLSNPTILSFPQLNSKINKM